MEGPSAVAFLHLLFKRPQRVTALMLHWHARQPSKGASVTAVWKDFVLTLLYAPLNLCVTSQGLYPFGDGKMGARAFFIAYEWLERDERTYLNGMIQHADRFFTQREKIYTGGHTVLSGFAGNRQKKALTMVMRKKMLRSFVSLVYQVVPVHRLTLYLILMELSIDKAEPYYMLLGDALIGYTPDGPSLTPVF